MCPTISPSAHVTKPGTSTRQITLINNIFCGNLAGDGDSVASTASGIADVSYCDAYPADNESAGRRNYSTASLGVCNLGSALLYVGPLFFDEAAGCYWLQSGSPLRAQGSNLGDENTADITGKDRPGTDNEFDIGAYESDPGNYGTTN